MEQLIIKATFGFIGLFNMLMNAHRLFSAARKHLARKQLEQIRNAAGNVITRGGAPKNGQFIDRFDDLIVSSIKGI